MQYLERTLQVRAALFEQPELLDNIRSVFEKLIIQKEHASEIEYWAGSGTSRDAFSIGECEIHNLGQVSILLKIFNEQHDFNGRTWVAAMGRPNTRLGWGVAEEFGAFEVYYDFVAEHIPHISFSSKRKLNGYNKDPLDRCLQQHLNLSDWDGTRVAVGDMGALPYFQMAVKWGKYFGWLTEGNPPIIAPKGTARHWGSDENNIERGRIIDLSAHHSSLRGINRKRPLGKYHRDYLGLIKRGKKYLLPENRLDL